MKNIAHLVNGKTRTGAISSIKRIIRNFDVPEFKLLYLVYGNFNRIEIQNGNYQDYIDLKFSYILGDFVSGRKNFRSLIKMFYYYFVDIFILLKYCKRNKIDIIHLHYFCDIFQFSVLRLFNIKVVSHIRAIVNKELFWGIPFYIFKRLTYLLSDKVIGISNASLEALERINSKKNDIIYNGLEGLEKSKNSELENVTCEYFIVGSVIRFAELKGIFLFRDVFFEFFKNENHENVKFLLIAKATDVESKKIKKDFFEEVKKRNLCDKLIYFEEFPDYSYIMPYIDLLFHTTQQREGFGNVVLEAHWFGKPVVSTPCLGVNDIIEYGKSGYILSSSKSVDEAVKYLDQLYSSMDLYQEFSINSYAIAHQPKFSITYSMDSLRSLYSEL